MNPTMPVDASLIAKGLWQGSAPVPGDAVRNSGFDLLVLCAEEYQPPDTDFPGVEVIHAPNSDCGMPVTRQQLALALQAARRVAAAIRQSKHVLVTCRLGLNRSGLVSALALHLLTGESGHVCIDIVQAHRKDSMGNASFNAALLRLPQSATVAQASS